MDTRILEIIDKDVTNPRLTITQDRITMKFPLDYANKENVIQAFAIIADQIGFPLYSLRGALHGTSIILRRDKNGEALHSFDISKLDVAVS